MYSRKDVPVAVKSLFFKPLTSRPENRTNVANFRTLKISAKIARSTVREIFAEIFKVIIYINVLGAP